MGIEGWPERHRAGMDNLGATLLRSTDEGGWTVGYYNRRLA
jgi:hypothetical protein